MCARISEVLWPFDGDSDSLSPPSSFCTWPVTNDSTSLQQAKRHITHLWQFTRLLVGITPTLATLPWMPRPAPVPLEVEGPYLLQQLNPIQQKFWGNVSEQQCPKCVPDALWYLERL